MLMKNIVVFSGSGIKRLSTFRDHGGLWDKFPIEELLLQMHGQIIQKKLCFYKILNTKPNYKKA